MGRKLHRNCLSKSSVCRIFEEACTATHSCLFVYDAGRHCTWVPEHWSEKNDETQIGFTKDVTYGGHGTLTLSGDYIQFSFTEVTGSITLSSGQPCPDIAQCTGLHPGATFSGSWTRKKQ